MLVNEPTRPNLVNLPPLIPLHDNVPMKILENFINLCCPVAPKHWFPRSRWEIQWVRPCFTNVGSEKQDDMRTEVDKAESAVCGSKW